MEEDLVITDESIDMQEIEAEVDGDGRIKLVNIGESIVWFGTNLIGKKGGTVSNPYITGTLTLEFVEYGDDDAVSIRNDTFGKGTAENKSIRLIFVIIINITKAIRIRRDRFVP